MSRSSTILCILASFVEANRLIGALLIAGVLLSCMHRVCTFIRKFVILENNNPRSNIRKQKYLPVIIPF